MRETLGFEFKEAFDSITNKGINLTLNEFLKNLGKEGYRLEINETLISVEGNALRGIFYGIQSLKQLFLEAKKNHSGKIQAQTIEDYPRFPWRGFMFDVGRHFHPAETVKKMLEILAFLKMNVLHFHFNEDQGWRIEIKKYPKLTEIGSKRKDTLIGSHISKKYRGIPHEGYYTQDEVKEIVEYASKRYISVVPELEIPGHSSAAIASYPELSCKDNQIEVRMRFGISPEIYCAGKEQTFQFLQDVLDELMNLFPSEIIHIGGDEAPKKRWKECEKCQERITTEGLKDEKELQEYVTNRIAVYLKEKGKRIMGWNQILGDSLDKSAIAHYWFGKKSEMRKHLYERRDFVMSNMSRTYLDYNYLMFPLRRFYNFDPIPKDTDPEYYDNVLGLEAPLWTEWVPNLERLGWQVFPRLIASAEVGWTQKKLMDYSDFKKRLPLILSYLEIVGMPHASLDEVDPSNFNRFIRLYRWLRWPKI